MTPYLIAAGVLVLLLLAGWLLRVFNGTANDSDAGPTRFEDDDNQ